MDRYYISDEYDKDSFDKKKASVTDHLERRNTDRLGNIAKSKEIKGLSSNELEDINEFEKKFVSKKTSIEHSLTSLDTSLEHADLVSRIDQLRLEVDELQKLLTSATGFLPPYTIQKYQDIIQVTFVKLDSVKDALIPKKKFGFRSKKKVAHSENKEKENKTAHTSKAKEPTPLIEGLYMDSGNSMFVKNRIEEHLTLSAVEVLNKDIIFQSLHNCTIEIYGNPGTVYFDDIENCTIYCGPVSRSIKIDHCCKSKFIVACQQLRIHNTNSSTFYIHVIAGAIIEDSTDLAFGEYSWSYFDINLHYETSGLDRKRNLWNDVKDFNRLASNEKSPNWTLLE